MIQKIENAHYMLFILSGEFKTYTFHNYRLTNNLKIVTHRPKTNWMKLIHIFLMNQISGFFGIYNKETCPSLFFTLSVGAYDGWGNGGWRGGQWGGRSWRSHERRPASAGLPVGRLVVHQHFLHLPRPWGTSTSCQLNSDVCALSVDSGEKTSTIDITNNNKNKYNMVCHVLASL